jgi:hypothetical protein
MELYLHSSILLNDEKIKATLVWLEKARPLSKLQCRCAVMIRQLLGFFCYAWSLNDVMQAFWSFCMKRNTDSTSGSYELITSCCNGHVACNFRARAQQQACSLWDKSWLEERERAVPVFALRVAFRIWQHSQWYRAFTLSPCFLKYCHVSGAPWPILTGSGSDDRTY